MSDDLKNDPADRLKNILSGGEPESVLSRLPRSPGDKPPVQPPKQPGSFQPVQAAGIQSGSGSAFKNLKFGPPFWTITGWLSLLVNGILVAVLIVMMRMIGILQGTAGDVGAGLIGGLFTNFEKMDRATIRTTIPVEAQIPLDLVVPVQTTTQITLAERVDIPNARVVITTGGVDIDADAFVSLPAGTPLLINLDFNLPVQATIPIQLEVPVTIPLANTELHEPFVGLQEVIRPLYCLVEPNALRIDGTLVCR